MKMQQITQKANELQNRVLADGYQATPRDVAEASELVSKYIDELERLERTVTVKPYLTGDMVADKVLSFWYPNEQ